MITMPKTRWREYLKGKYKINNKNTKTQVRHNIRERATQMMKDLLLICEKASERDKILIFKDPETRDNIVIPLLKELTFHAKPTDNPLNEIMLLADGLHLYGIKYDLVRLMKNPEYRKRKRYQCRREALKLGLIPKD